MTTLEYSQVRKGATSAVKRFIATTNLAATPADAVHMAKRCLIDGFGVILAGSTVQGSAIVRQYIKATTDKKDATALGPEKLMATAALAALANGASGHAMDYDDTQLSTTPDRTFGLLTHPTLPPDDFAQSASFFGSRVPSMTECPCLMNPEPSVWATIAEPRMPTFIAESCRWSV